MSKKNRLPLLILVLVLVSTALVLVAADNSDITSKKELYRIAIIDSGFTPGIVGDTHKKLCKDGHYDFSENKRQVGIDLYPHGSMVAGIINMTAKSDNICFVIIKIDENFLTFEDSFTKALLKAEEANVQAVNISLIFPHFNHKAEKVLKRMTKNDVKFFIAAGNDSTNLNLLCQRYPQCTRTNSNNVFIVGATDVMGTPAHYTNYGSIVTVWENGSFMGALGTSFAAPRALGRYVDSLNLDGK